MVTLHSVGRMAQKLLKRSLSYSWKSYQFRGFTSSDSLLLSLFTVFRMVEASLKREWLVMNRKGPWEGYRRQAKPVVSFPPSFARIFSSREGRLGTRQLLPSSVTDLIKHPEQHNLRRFWEGACQRMVRYNCNFGITINDVIKKRKGIKRVYCSSFNVDWGSWSSSIWWL